jgi:hypothetical protein
MVVFSVHDNEQPDSLKVENFLISWVNMNFLREILHNEIN